MLEQLKYINHQNEVFEFGKDGIFVESNDLRDYEWEVTTKNNKISAFTRGVASRTLPVVIICRTEAEGIAAKNKLLEIAEKDIYAKQPGRIVIGNYYFKCFVTKSQKSNYLLAKRHLKETLTLTSDFPYWVKETRISFRTAVSTYANRQRNLDFPHDYPIDYASDFQSSQLNNTGFVASSFRMMIYGPCVDPTVYIAGHAYQVNCDVGENEYLTIDAATKRIYLTQNDGTEINVFNSRNRDSYIFEKIPPGNSNVSWDGDFSFDVVLLEERSAPKWT